MSQWQLDTFDDVAAFQAVALPFLRPDSARYNQLLLACERLQQADVLPQRHWLACLRQQGEVVAVACCSSPLPMRNLSLSAWPGAGLSLLAEALPPLQLQTISAPLATILALRPLLAGSQLRMRLRSYVLQTPPALPPVEGALRLAEPDDIALMLDWFAAFEAETDVPPRPAAVLRQGFEEDMQPGSPRRCYLWQVNGAVVALSGMYHQAGIARIGPVYTPPALRGHGYASALVARQCQLALSHGAQWVCLYADAANPTSNALYQRIGFQFVDEFAWLDCASPTPG